MEDLRIRVAEGRDKDTGKARYMFDMVFGESDTISPAMTGTDEYQECDPETVRIVHHRKIVSETASRITRGKEEIVDVTLGGDILMAYRDAWRDRMEHTLGSN